MQVHSLYVHPLQARPTKCCGRRTRYGKTWSLYVYSYHRAYNAYHTYYVALRGMGSTTTTPVYTSIYHDIVHRARGDFQHVRHYGRCILPLLKVIVMLSGSPWIIKPARGAQISLPVRTSVFFGEESACTAGRLGVGLFGDSDGEYMKNSVPWKRKHRAGPLE